MRPYGLDEQEQLSLARSRAEELRQAWQMANAVRPGANRNWDPARPGVVRSGREAVGRAIVAFGRHVLPRRVEPCD